MIRQHGRLKELGVTQMLISRAKGGLYRNVSANGSNIIVVYFLDANNVERAHYFYDVTPWDEIVEYTRQWNVETMHFYERVDIAQRLKEYVDREAILEARYVAYQKMAASSVLIST